MHVGSLCPVVGRKLRALPNLPVQSWVDQRQAIRFSGGNLRSRRRSFQQRRAQEAEDADIWKRQRTTAVDPLRFRGQAEETRSNG